MAHSERVKELSAQLLRAKNPLVIQMVADQLKAAIDVYAESVQQDYPVIELASLKSEQSAA